MVRRCNQLLQKGRVSEVSTYLLYICTTYLELWRNRFLSCSSFRKSPGKVWCKECSWNNWRLKQVLHHSPWMWFSLWMRTATIHSVQGSLLQERMGDPWFCWSSLQCFRIGMDGELQLLILVQEAVPTSSATISNKCRTQSSCLDSCPPCTLLGTPGTLLHLNKEDSNKFETLSYTVKMN